MQESDGILLATLAELLQLPQIRNASFSSLQSDSLTSISFKTLEYFGVDTAEVTLLANKSQRFRSMARLNQLLTKELHFQFELGELMTPTPTFSRKFVTAVLNRVATKEGDKATNGNQPEQGQFQGGKRRKIYKQWLESEWIHPALLTQRGYARAYLLPVTITKGLLKTTNTLLTEQLQNSHLKDSVSAILADTISRHRLKVKSFTQKEGLAQKDLSEELAVTIQSVSRANRQEWFRGALKTNKPKKQYPEETQQQHCRTQQIEAAQEGERSDAKEGEAAIQQQEKIFASLDNPLEALRQEIEHKNKLSEDSIRALLTELKEKKEQFEKIETLKATVRTACLQDEQTRQNLIAQAAQFKKSVEKRQAILNSIETGRDVQAEVAKLEREVEELKKEAEEQITQAETQINEIVRSSKDRMDALQDLKGKLNKIETEYHEISVEIEQKREMKGRVKIVKSELPRAVYNRKITEMEQRWRQTQKETGRIRDSLKQLREKVTHSVRKNVRMEGQITSMLGAPKGQMEAKALREVIEKCIQTYNATINTVYQINETKEEAQQYEVKVHQLTGKNYKPAIEKIQLALEDLEKELRELQKMK